ncbi:FkbM family methyltransferase [Kordia sp. YSTF-M3]|uniref:FkbM family methyltransferase n=1 Tax=Kordia aestuariivivens TaxID=2759037 RepID=A0ABR7Q9A1_9FLAO|nr:FkbM family methyltransferase [Kordia aestuariivivens]MBC8755130.1 FkbM family methyltransferase [Kordia aestuariivivens]
MIKKVLKKLKKRRKKFQSHPLINGNGYDALFRYIKFNAIQTIKPKTRIYNWIHGLKFYAKKGDAGIVSNIYIKLADYEDSMFLMHHLHENDLFVDIGANVGHFTLLASGVSKARTIAIEPIPNTYEKLQKNINLNNLQDKVECLNIGLGEDKGELKFTKGYDVMNRVALENENVPTISVPVQKLDEVLQNEQPTFLKIDVEGFEYYVLKGATETLKKESLKYILLEFNNSGSRFGISDEKVFDFVTSYGFKPLSYHVDKKEVTLENSFRTDKFNTIFIRA